MHSPQHLYSNFTLIPVRKVVRCESDYHVAGLGLILTMMGTVQGSDLLGASYDNKSATCENMFPFEYA